ncbi:MAG: hypothetical protein CMH31_05940 [Micavibrio sp.]|nr:hypothetical protein [Micavibrio sp.]|tara:strand:- start:1143 stop:1559 length:417 start_codon:yes stop_codon:yes gene_type:complete
MFKYINKKSLQFSSVAVIAMMSGAEDALAQGRGTGGSGADFSTIGENITTSISGLPGLLSGVSYMLGILLGVLGILKIKDHVENPSQHPLQQGAIRLLAGGGLFALPLVYEAMNNSIGDANSSVAARNLQAVTFAVTP